MTPVQAETRASAIRIGNPASWRKAVRALQSTGGWCEQVSETEIAVAKAQIGAEGIGCEPASAVTLAGLKKLVAAGHIAEEDRVVLILTGPHPERLRLHHSLPPRRAVERLGARLAAL